LLVNLIVFALRRPLTILVAIVAVALTCGLAVRPKSVDAWLAKSGVELPLKRMAIDIFPSLNLPVIYVCQPYGGMDPAQMEGLLTNYYEYHFLYISNIHHVESRNVQGMALMKLTFHSGTNMAQAMAETINYVNRSRAFMPPGTVSPFVMRFDTGSVPVGYLVLSSATKTVNEIQDQALFKVRPMFSALPGVSAPPPFGGSARSIVIRADPDRLRSYGVSPDDVVTALSNGNTISPSGNLHVGERYPIVPTNALVKNPQDLGAIPIKRSGDATVYLRDIGVIEDAADITVGYALVNSRRAVYILATKRAEASTMSVIDEIKAALPRMQKELPDDITVAFEFDQSPYVTRAIGSLWNEGLLGACLTGLMVLIFLRDWRSALVVVINIPLALMSSIVGLWLTGQTINLMTLGGLALAVGILVDEATVEIENIHTQFEHTDSIARAVRLGNAQTAIPRLLAMLCILAVFVPSFVMEGAARELFVPLSLAVGFAMIASYFLSSTFVPVVSVWLLRHGRLASTHESAASRVPSPPFSGERARVMPSDGVDATKLDSCGPNAVASSKEPESASKAPLTSPVSLQGRGDGTGKDSRRSSVIVRCYRWLVTLLVSSRPIVVLGYVVGCAAILVGVGGRLGWEIFPATDAGEFRLRLRAPDGTHITKTEQIAIEVLDAIREQVGAEHVDLTLGYVGSIPSSYPINGVYQWSRGPEEALLRIALKHGSGVSTEAMKDVLRHELAKRFPDVRCSFEPADIISEVMSFGSPTPIEIAARGANLAENRAYIVKVKEALEELPFLRDVQIAQSLDYPTVDVQINREKAGVSGTTSAQISRSVVAATSSSRFTVPNYWPDPKTGIGYQVQLEIPQPVLRNAEDLGMVPIHRGRERPLLLRDVAEIAPGKMPGQFDRYNMKREISLTANIVGLDLGRASKQVLAVLNRLDKSGDKPASVTQGLRGQIPPMRQMLNGLGVGLVLAVVVIFLLLTAIFQSMRLSLVAVSSAPAVVAGVVLALFLTGSTINIQSAIGSIMAIGVAMANAILLVTFADQRRHAGESGCDAAIHGAASRLRPILMTSFAMTAGMLPMALGWGESGQQTAPLGRAVIGGLIAATLATLFVLPSVFALLMGRATSKSASLDPDDHASIHCDLDSAVSATAQGLKS
jgi:multidrug efflux pump subunit AcrB